MNYATDRARSDGSGGNFSVAGGVDNYVGAAAGSSSGFASGVADQLGSQMAQGAPSSQVVKNRRCHIFLDKLLLLHV